MFGLTLVGLVSLNDPPRPAVAQSILKCKSAGIKVIMITGDQTNTAAANAAKDNIITDPNLEYTALLENGLEPEDAWSKCRAVVIHGDELAERHLD